MLADEQNSGFSTERIPALGFRGLGPFHSWGGTYGSAGIALSTVIHTPRLSVSCWGTSILSYKVKEFRVQGLGFRVRRFWTTMFIDQGIRPGTRKPNEFRNRAP